jgi:molybdopterin-guanine dinucleotide biosynthesis protein A
VTGIILAGGKSQRMGRQKLSLKVGGVPLFERVYSLLNQIFADIIVVANRPESFRSSGARVISDVIPSKGALGGLYTGLTYASDHHTFCFGADMPFLNGRLIRYMVERRHEGDVIIPKTPDGLQPLHAVYSKECLRPIKKVLARGGLKIIDFFTDVTVVYVSEKEILDFDPLLISFLNVNTEEDLMKAEKILLQDRGVNSS